MPDPVIDGVTYDEGDFITKEALANDYFVLNTDLRYTSDILNLTGGVNLSRYDGDHIGSVLWSNVLGDAFDYDSHEWYLNRGLKHEASAFVRGEVTCFDGGVCTVLFSAPDPGGQTDGRPDGAVAGGNAGIHVRGPAAVWTGRFPAGTDWTLDGRGSGGALLEGRVAASGTIGQESR